MIQVLKGVKITPKGSRNRFVSQNWPNSYAFGGWIYNASTSIGFSSNPTEIKISIVLETSTFNQSAAKFDIKESDLHCDAGSGSLDEEILYDIELEGIKFKDFILYQYDFSIEVNQKILNVVFKDYSIILDKIYVGLFKKQGYQNRYGADCKVKFPITCQDCSYSALSSIKGLGIANRYIEFASYRGANGRSSSNFQNFYYFEGKNVFDYWLDHLIKIAENPGEKGGDGNCSFNLNGGYLILGTESAIEQNCNSAPEVTYSFAEFISSLRRAGLNFIGDFPKSYSLENNQTEIIEGINLFYKANYVGNLREVLQNWCSDLGYDFYFSGRSIVGINLKNPIDISDITKVSDPSTKLGSNFAINGQGNSAILSFKSSSSLANTFKQSVIVENSHPITEVTNQKTIKRYVNMLPLHPVSLNIYNSRIISDNNINGISFARPAFETDYFNDYYFNQSQNYNFFLLDGRSYRDLDTAIALSKYNDVLRDIYVAQKALEENPSSENVPNSDDILSNFNSKANFYALGMDPIVEISDPQFKSDILVDFFSNGEKNEISNLNMDAQYFRIFLGYYNENLKNEIVDWEKKAAESMYKYGIVTNGNLTKFPYVSPDFVLDISPTAGFYGKNGLWYTTIKNDFSPSASRYTEHGSPPFADVLINYELIRQKFVSNSLKMPSGLWFAPLDNDWGTTNEDFNSQLSLDIEDQCVSQYGLEDSVSSIISSDTRQSQDWKLEYFRPIASPNLSKIDDIIQGGKYNIDQYVDNVVSIYFDNNLHAKKECKKIHVLIIPDTKRHPNLNIFFTQNPRNRINPVVLNNFKQKLFDMEYEKSKTKTPSICSLSLSQEMCKNALRGEIYDLKNENVKLSFPISRTNCSTFEDRTTSFIEGFSNETLTSINSRSLSINIYKNPPEPDGDKIGPISDVNGDYYYADLNTDLDISRKNSFLEIIYPIQCESINQINRANYLAILSTNIETDLRMPAMNMIYGEPVNTPYNNVSALKVINQITDNSLNPYLNPINNEVSSYLTVITGGGSSNVISTPEQYYNLVKELNNYNLDSPMKIVEMELAGGPKEFGNFVDYLTPSSGLNQISISITDNGVKTSLSFSDRPKKLPKQEAILNKIGPRIKGTYK